MAKRKSDPLAEAGRIIQDATEVDWTREPLTEYEAAIRAEYLRTQLQTVNGRSAIMHLAFMHEGCLGSDLEAAEDDALALIKLRLARAEWDDLAKARRAVDRRRR